MSTEEIAADFHLLYGFPVPPARIAETLREIDEAAGSS
jgi:hypothetical protein